VSDANVKLTERFNEGMARGEVLWELIDPNIEVHDHDLPDGGAYQGHDGFGKWLEDWGAAWDSYTVEPEEYFEAGDSVVSVFTMVAKGKGSGIETRRRNATVSLFKDAVLARLDYYTTKEEAFEAAGLEQGTAAK
jgi:hypothetical protein